REKPAEGGGQEALAHPGAGPLDHQTRRPLRHLTDAREAPAQRAPELGPLPAGFLETLPLLVVVGAREEDRDHLLAAAVPESEPPRCRRARAALGREKGAARDARSEEHTSELQSR